MKKLFILKSITMIIVLITSMCFVSCTPEPEGPKEDNTGKEEQKEVGNTIRVGLLCSLTEDHLKFYDFSAVIKFDDVVYKEFTINQILWEHIEDIEDVKASQLSYEIYGRAKAEFPGVDANKSYELGYSTDYYAIIKSPSGAETTPSRTTGASGANTITLAGNKVEEWVTKLPEFPLLHLYFDLTNL